SPACCRSPRYSARVASVSWGTSSASNPITRTGINQRMSFVVQQVSRFVGNRMVHYRLIGPHLDVAPQQLLVLRPFLLDLIKLYLLRGGTRVFGLLVEDQQIGVRADILRLQLKRAGQFL